MARRASESRRVEVAFRKVIAAVVVFNDAVGRRTGLGAAESQFLHLLQLHGTMTPSDFVRRSGLASATVTGVLDRLEELGFVRRERHASDRRKVVVVLDEARVNETLAPHFADQASHLADVTARFAPAQLGVVADFLESLLGPEA